MIRGTARRMISVTLAVSMAFLASVAFVDSGSAATIEGAVQNPDNGHWYKYVAGTPQVSWAAAKSGAEALGGSLASITSSEENQWIVQNLGIPAGTESYIGATDEAAEGTWQWLNGDAWTWSNWSSGEPNNCCGGEHYLELYSSGVWNDDPSWAYDPGYIVEWNSDPNAPVVVPPPAAPTQLTASYSESDGVTLAWTDDSSDEAGFTIERKPTGYSFARRDATAANVTSYVDRLLYPSTTYTYRVRAFNSGGDSPWSNEASATTAAGVPVPAPPLAPSHLVASLDTAGVDLAWTDNSADETLFALERAADGAAFKVLATTPSDKTQRDDDAVHPGWPYVYRVRALSLQGPSPYSNTAGASLTATWEMTLGAGSLTDSAKLKRDKLKVAGGYVVPDGAAFDPVAQGVEILAGPSNAPVAVSIAPADATWKSRKGKLTWKSPKGAASKVSVVIDTTRGTFTVSISGLDFASAPGTAVRLLVASGPLGGGAAATWTERKPGSLRSE
jgi:hypothetical protein